MRLLQPDCRRSSEACWRRREKAPFLLYVEVLQPDQADAEKPAGAEPAGAEVLQVGFHNDLLVCRQLAVLEALRIFCMATRLLGHWQLRCQVALSL